MEIEFLDDKEIDNWKKDNKFFIDWNVEYNKNLKLIRSECAKYLGWDNPFLDDCTSSTFEQALLMGEKYNFNIPLLKYLRGIAKHTCFRQKKSKRNDFQFVEDLDFIEEIEEEIQIDEIYEQIKGIIYLLKESKGKKYLLEVLNGKRYDFIMNKYGVKYSAVSSALHNCLNEIREMLQINKKSNKKFPSLFNKKGKKQNKHVECGIIQYDLTNKNLPPFYVIKNKKIIGKFFTLEEARAAKNKDIYSI